ncbi:Dead box ATP-dependent RNA helicase putative isoform 1 [Tripterygium wilfordii]|uniref:Dead box ATP-dependent RNA helicase putative isoform 1 n=1 Tax=Tripterygium wilfordii TaxID=458696 RepID=A0A7J7DSA5_TRIWF|nr:DEAD-box ATP-dependent RNA helicase 39-like [Tripterygium wilfordii]KAF5749245.1 Dead box ATP-dependent RNA helicase putative isoform 1 [Tripterygium wilfordii]
MRGGRKALLCLSLSKKLVTSTKVSEQVYASTKLAPLSTCTSTGAGVSKDEKDQPPQSKRDSSLLEKFRQRKLQGRLGPTQTTPPLSSSGSSSERVLRRSEDCLQNDKRGARPSEEVLSGFEELGLREGLIGALLEMGVSAPSEIQCVGIPAILEGKCLVLSSDSGPGRSLAYLLPLVQLLQRDETLSRMKPKHPRAIVLCTTDEQSDEGFHMAKFISHHARLKPGTETSSSQSRSQQELSNAPIGMLVGTPSEVLQFMEEGSVILDDVKYLVLDEADTMLNRGFGPEINRMVTPLRKHALKRNNHGLQTVLITSTISKMLGDEVSRLMESLERNHAGKVAAAVLEMEQMEVFDLLESPDALKKRVAEAMDSLHSCASET